VIASGCDGSSSREVAPGDHSAPTSDLSGQR
jgi:hypothetical protein